MHMNFSEDAQHSYFFSQPHQPFFVLAFVNAIVSMLIFLLSYKGVIPMAVTPSHFHAYGFTYLLFTPAFFGFLFTTFPRFASTPTIKKKNYMRIFHYCYIGSTLFLFGSMVSPFLSAVGMMILFIGHTLGYLILKNIYTTTTMKDRDDIFWIQLAVACGLGAHLLFIVGKLWIDPLIGISTEISTYLYLFFVAFSVAQRMVPFFSHCMIEKNMALLKQIFILLLLHLLLEVLKMHSSFFIDFFIAYIIGKELLRWKLPFPNSNPLLWILHLALFWVPVGFMLSGLTNLLSLVIGIYFLALDIHTIMLGFVFTILIGFGTRVTLGHSGNQMFADRYTSFLFVWTQAVVALRILTSLVAALGWNFMILFDITAIAWIVMFVAWSVRFLAVLVYGRKL